MATAFSNRRNNPRRKTGDEPVPQPGGAHAGPGSAQRGLAWNAGPAFVIQGAFATYEQVNAADTDEHPIVANRALNTTPTPLMGGGSNASGLGKTHDPEGANVNLQTQITWSAPEVDDQGYGDGKKMVADPLGPDHKRGSAPGGGNDKPWIERRKRLSKVAKGHEYIAGHLLNHNLGGPGNVAENLAAIPDEINKAHSREIEEHVKAYVDGKGGWGKYTVEITHGKDTGNVLYASNLHAEWIPYTLVEKENDQTGLTEYFYEPAKGRRVTFDQPIPAPSAYQSKGAMAKTNEAKVKKTKSLASPLLTPFGFDELPLTPNTSLIVRFGLKNVLMIKQLQQQGQDISAESEQLKEQVKEFEQKLEELEAEKAQLADKVEEHELAHYEELRRRKAEEQLVAGLQRQLEAMSKRLEQAQSHGLRLTSFGFGEELFSMLLNEGALDPLLDQPFAQSNQFITTATAQLIMVTPTFETVDLPQGVLVQQLPQHGPRSALYTEVRVLSGPHTGKSGSVRRDLLRSA